MCTWEWIITNYFFLYVETETAYILTSFPMIVLVLMLELCIYTGNREKVRWKALTEEHARDSFENLLFSVCRFRELTGSYPQNITVCSFLILFDLMEDLMGTWLKSICKCRLWDMISRKKDLLIYTDLQLGSQRHDSSIWGHQQQQHQKKQH